MVYLNFKKRFFVFLFLLFVFSYFLFFNSVFVFSYSDSCNNNFFDYFNFKPTGSDSSFKISVSSDSNDKNFVSSFDVSYAFKITPKTSVVKEVKNVQFLSDGFFNEDFNILSLTFEKNNDEFVVHLTLSPKNFNLENLNSDFDGVVGFSALITFVDLNDEEKTMLFCLPSFDVSIVLDSDVIPDDLKKGISSSKKKYELFKKLDSAAGVLQVTYTVLCEDKKDNYTRSVENFNNKCSIVKDVLKEKLEGKEFNLDVFCSENKDSFSGSSDEVKISNCKNNFDYCEEEYNNILKYEKNMLDVCMRVSCNPVFSKEEHSKKYNDFLGINYCKTDNKGNVLDEEKCNSQYERIENPKCEFLDINFLNDNKNVFSFKNDYESQICGSPKENVKTLIDPSSSIVSSAACLCVPSLLGYIDTYKDLYKNYVSCLEGKGEKKASDCLNVNYVFLCETILDSFSCGYLDLASYSANVNSFLDENNKAYIIDVSPVSLKNKVEDKYSLFKNNYLKASFNANTVSLKNAICRSAFGDENIDWSKVLLNAVSFDNFESSLTSGVNFCDVNKNLKGSCYCGSRIEVASNVNNVNNEGNNINNNFNVNVNLNFKNNCGENFVCTFENENFKCKKKDEVNIPNNKENERIEEKIVLHNNIVSYDKSSDAIIFYSNNNDVVERVPYCKNTDTGIEVLDKVLITENNIIIPEFFSYNNKRKVSENLFPSKYIIDYCDSISYSCRDKSFVFKGDNCNYVKILGDTLSSFKGNIFEETPIKVDVIVND